MFSWFLPGKTANFDFTWLDFDFAWPRKRLYSGLEAAVQQARQIKELPPSALAAVRDELKQTQAGKVHVELGGKKIGKERGGKEGP